MAQSNKKSLKVCNFIHQDEIWKDHVRTEHTAEKRWKPRHGYTTDIYDNLESSLNGSNRTLTEEEELLIKSRSFSSDASTSNMKSKKGDKNFINEMGYQKSVIQDARRIEQDQEKRDRFQKGRKLIDEKPISQALPPSFTIDNRLLNKVSSQAGKLDGITKCDRSYPKTTSDEIGWCSKCKNLNNPTYGTINHRAKGKHTLYKKLGWPIESTM
jgi:hypothetical protein